MWNDSDVRIYNFSFLYDWSHPRSHGRNRKKKKKTRIDQVDICLYSCIRKKKSKFQYDSFDSIDNIFEMLFSPTFLIACVLLLVIGYYLFPIFRRHRQLLKDYRNISPLPLSSIPLIGNLHQFDKRQPVFFQLLCRLAKQCQDQGTGLFCLWTGMVPRLFLCSSEGLEVWILHQHHSRIIFISVYSLYFKITNIMSNLGVTHYLVHGLEQV